ncbi:Inactive serine protease PAMR1 [Willisornis vidua]|uniref:Inactive serine protease PAMR1 n=1 Tax=Willisornis vidua TaxID=1566151 RepID=A0ABQ9DD10_9PASS|nr:Inactive serine protease PAMR1 [Willisornis vidua]
MLCYHDTKNYARARTAEAALVCYLSSSFCDHFQCLAFTEHTRTPYAKAVLQAPRKVLGPPTQEGCGPLGTSPEDSSEDNQRDGALLLGRQAERTGFFSPEKRRLQGDLRAALHYLKGSYERDREDFSQGHMIIGLGRMALGGRKVDLDIRKEFVTVRVRSNAIAKQHKQRMSKLPQRTPGAPAHGIVEGDDFKYGAQVYFKCNAGYSLKGSHVAYCQLDGIWSTHHPECVLDQKNCSDPGGPLNGYRRVVEDTGLLNGHYAKIGTVIAFFCNNSYVLSGNEQRTCQDDGEWSGKQPICIKACREPKISDLVRQKVLPMQVQSSKQKLQIYPTKKPALPFGELPPGYQHLHTQLQYECVSPFYRRLGSSRRTCLKTGKWSGRAPVCIPICGKAENLTVQKTMTSTRWPWQAAIYRTANGMKENSLRKGAWILICSGALVNERTVVVAAHCVTDLGKTIVLKTAELKVVLGKFYRDDDRDEKTIQNLRISAIIVHPNYDPILLDSDIAIIKLLDKARISSRVQPICLSSSHDLTTSTEDLKIMVTGWKVLADIKDPGYKNDTIRMGTVQMVDSLLCEQQYEDNGMQVSITDSMFCAKQDHTAFSNICPAETGGIAAITLPGKASPELRWHLMGLVSWGYDKTCHLGLYSGYTKALPFKDWIEKNMK